MKKLKSFYKNNEKTILVCSGIAIGTYVSTLHTLHLLDGKQLVNADVLKVTETGQKILRVTFKNGSIRDYLWNYTEIPTA